MITWMTRQEAADYLRVSTDTIDRYARDNKIIKYNVAGTRSVRFKVSELDALVTPEGAECEHSRWEPGVWTGGKPFRGELGWSCSNCECPIEMVEPVEQLALICGHMLDLTQPISDVRLALDEHFNERENGECTYGEEEEDPDERSCPEKVPDCTCTH